jgi:hypothetical protein
MMRHTRGAPGAEFAGDGQGAGRESTGRASKRRSSDRRAGRSVRAGSAASRRPDSLVSLARIRTDAGARRQAAHRAVRSALGRRSGAGCCEAFCSQAAQTAAPANVASRVALAEAGQAPAASLPWPFECHPHLPSRRADTQAESRLY